MEKFLRAYVKNILEVREETVSRMQLTSIVNSLMNNDELWDTFDSFVFEAIDEEVK